MRYRISKSILPIAAAASARVAAVCGPMCRRRSRSSGQAIAVLHIRRRVHDDADDA